MRAILYTRLSIDRDGTAEGPDRQRADCRRLAEAKGWEVVAEYEDRDMSAFSGKRRPGYEAVLDDLRSGRADVVLAWKLDRLSRQGLT
ncbi:MAG TPA: recombinase family protein, partial [Acidimicrobiales bacterium]